MKRFLFAIIGGLLTLQLVPATAYAGVNDFYIADYDMKFQLSKNAENRSLLTTRETITAIFPETDQNHGIERAIPTRYDDHSTSLKLVSVTDENSQKLPYSTSEQNDNLVVRIGKADTYVHGAKTYVLTYRQQDVTKYFADTKRDEFYWDTNGDQWRVPINRLTVSLTIDAGLMARLTGDAACYQGTIGSTDRCTIQSEDGIFTVSAANLTPYQNVTLAVGFTPDTFSAYQLSLWEQLAAVWVIIAAVTAIIAVGLLVWFSVRYGRRSNRVADRTTIVPEYLPPESVSVTAASAIYPAAKATFTAQLLDFAVRHYLKIYQTADKTWLRPAKYELEIVKDIRNLSIEERDLISDIFSDTSVGTRLKMDDLRNNYTVAKRMRDNPQIIKEEIRGRYGLRARDEKESSWYKKAGMISLIAAVLTLSPAFLILAGVAYICAYTLYPLTDKGLALWHYLEGLKMYIKVAETERLKMLQSPEGAAKVGDNLDAKKPKQLIKLYERVLPYAVLFGQEKEWNKQIGQYYESIQDQPDWYSGQTAFNAAVFSTAMSNFATAASYTTASSSSSGGSSGGGSSGGGGGGGGGGCW